MWDDLRRRAEAARDRRIADLLDADRAADFSVEACGMHLDYSKTTLAASDRDLLVALCRDAGLEARRDAMFAGRRINETEGRAVLHTALRNLDGGPVEVDGQDVMPQVQATLERMETFARAVRDGAFRGQGGPVTDIVNIGIGGSDLGPAMAVQALAAYHDGPRCHFVSNVDAAHVADTLRRLDPATTLVIVASKTFTTIETMTNAATAKAWMSEAVADPGAQFAALSTAADRTAAFGIDAARVFGFADWVGGRYSVWGPIGLALMIAIGPEAFRAFLRGAEAMDRHFRAAEPLENMPVMLALVGLWHNQGCGYATRAVLPYEQRLGRLPAYLQQLEMESNGKRVAMDGTTLAVESGPVVWGEPGTNGQHAFYQLIHQGTRIVPCEFMVGAEGHEPDLAHQHRLLIANCLAQAEALMTGRTFSAAKALLGDRFDGEELDRQARHRVFPGNRPSTMLLYPKLTPEVLGQIMALYEHRVFVEGVCLGINSFDQWGVELGKELAEALAPVVAGDESAEGKDASTAALVGWLGAAPGMSAPDVPQQMAVLTLAVADLDRARAFYDAGFGWRPVFETDTIAFYQMNGFVLGLFLEAAFAEDAARAVGSGGRVAMAHNVPGRDDVGPLMDRLLASGGTLLRAADAPPHGGFRGYVADPDGHAWEIAWNPDWPIDAEGRVTFAL